MNKMISREEILKQADSLPTLPTAVARLSELIGDPNVRARDIEEVILPDPSLTANLLRLANSAYFGLRREVESVRQAVTLMGEKRVFELAAGASFSRILPPTIPGYGIESSQFWMHSIAVAILSEILAKETRTGSPNLLFTAGLLHDIGKLVVGSFLVDCSQEVSTLVKEKGVTFFKAEKEVLGVNHSEIGSDVATLWNLPEAVLWGTRWHHNPGEIPDDVDGMLIDLIHTADALANALGYGSDSCDFAQSVEAGAIERLGLDLEGLEIVAGETQDKILAMGKMFSGG